MSTLNITDELITTLQILTIASRKRYEELQRKSLLNKLRTILLENETYNRRETDK